MARDKCDTEIDNNRDAVMKNVIILQSRGSWILSMAGKRSLIIPRKGTRMLVSVLCYFVIV